MKLPWIDPYGGLGDVLMLSSVLALLVDSGSTRRFGLVRRKNYASLLEGHPALVEIGHPPIDAEIVSSAYWMEPDFHDKRLRAFQTLAGRFGLPLPVDERLYLPGILPSVADLEAFLPGDRPRVALCPASQSPRKELSVSVWEDLTRRLHRVGAFVAQFGRMGDPSIPGTFSLLGLTNPRQALALLSRFDLVVTVDNFFQHGARFLELPTVALWGPTRHEVYGYDRHRNLQVEARCANPGGCLVPGCGEAYASPCPLGEGHCLSSMDPSRLFDACRDALHAGSVDLPRP